MGTKRQLVGHILVVDDDRRAREQHTQSLNAAAFDVHAVEGGIEALEDLDSESFDLVLTDASIPDMDGLSLLQRIREMEPDLPIILLTAARDNTTVLRASESGALCLSKPIDARMLVMAVRQRIGLAASLPNLRATVASKEPVETVSATLAKNEFGRVMDMAVRKGRVVITKHQTPRAVLFSFDEYTRLVGASDPELDTLTEEFDELLARMQTPAARAGAQAAFAMSPAELGEAAVAAAKKRD